MSGEVCQMKSAQCWPWLAMHELSMAATFIKLWALARIAIFCAEAANATLVQKFVFAVCLPLF